MIIFERILQMIVKVITSLNELLWGDLFILEFSNGETRFGISLLVIILIPAGIYFTCKTRFLPFRLFPEMVRVTLEKKSSNEKGSISGLQALIIATATRVGMGNLAGVVAAISFGGAGAVFWMWLSALIGSSSAFIESTLAQIYKEKDPLYGGFRGGPAYFMDRMRLNMLQVTSRPIIQEAANSHSWAWHLHFPAFCAGQESARWLPIP